MFSFRNQSDRSKCHDPLLLLAEQANSFEFAQFFSLHCSHELTMFAEITGKSGRTKIHVIIDETISPWHATALLAKNKIIIHILPQKNISFLRLMHLNCLESISNDLLSAAASERFRLNLLTKMVDQTTHFPHILFHHWPSSSSCIVSIKK